MTRRLPSAGLRSAVPAVLGTEAGGRHVCSIAWLPSTHASALRDAQVHLAPLMSLGAAKLAPSSLPGS